MPGEPLDATTPEEQRRVSELEITDGPGGQEFCPGRGRHE